MSRVKDITGRKYGYLTVIKKDGFFSEGSVYWLCKCACGKYTHATHYQLTKGVKRSCGCFKILSSRKFNTYKIEGEVTKVFDSKGNYCLIDTKLLPRVKTKYWFLGSNYFESTTGTKKKFRISLHRFVLNDFDMSHDIDHINRNKLDNRVENLRVASRAQNNINKNTSKKNTTGYTGVSFRKNKGDFRAYITVNGKQKHLGLFSSAEEAYKARLEAEKLYYDEFSSEIGGGGCK